jgi:hypothetical protein
MLTRSRRALREDTEDRGFFGTLKAKIIAVTGVLLVVPALMNAGFDIYAAAAKLPRSEAEKDNLELFEKYFRKAPLVVNALPIRSPIGVVEARFAVYEEGEIHVEFGNRSQWFRFPKIAPQAHAWLLDFIPSAAAQTKPVPTFKPSVAGEVLTFRQSERIEGNALIRQRELSNGKTEETKYDLRTGDIKARRLLEGSDLYKDDSLQVPRAQKLKELRLD